MEYTIKPLLLGKFKGSSCKCRKIAILFLAQD